MSTLHKQHALKNPRLHNHIDKFVMQIPAFGPNIAQKPRNRANLAGCFSLAALSRVFSFFFFSDGSQIEASRWLPADVIE